MTRVTNFGRKRSFVEAGFHEGPETSTIGLPLNEDSGLHGSLTTAGSSTGQAEPVLPPKKKKRKRTKMSKRDGNKTKEVTDTGDVNPETSGIQEDEENVKGEVDSGKRKAKSKKSRGKDKKQKISLSEQRRLKRIKEKQAETTCFACREKGHAAKYCPLTQKKASEDGTVITRDVVGICYRCGSTKHTLSRCKKPPNEMNPLPFASCFVCSEKGHLASTCPRNKSKGIYPNGGSCKLCGDTSHLAKDCGLRKQDVTNSSDMLGTGREAGADEDDFHTFKRRAGEVERDEKMEDKAKRSLDVKAGVHSGLVKAFGAPPYATSKKVVYF